MANQVIVPYESSKEGKAKQIENMFDNVSNRYDFLNRVITLRMDKGWRNNILKIISKRNPQKILDIATGTGDMAILFAKTNAKEIKGVDISSGMLGIADEKIKNLNLQDRITTEKQNSEDLKFQDNSYDVISVTYGIRNFENLKKGLSEIYRVLDKNGMFVILETSVPKNPIIKAGYLFYTKNIMPRISKIFSKDKHAYQYLSDSAINFPYGEELKGIIETIGFKNVKIIPQFFGVSTIYLAEK